MRKFSTATMTHEAIQQIPSTPSLMIDLPIVDRNVERMMSYLHANRINLRPHTKTHKCIAFAKRQIAEGASGLTVAKVGEAELMAQVSKDLLIAYPAIDPARCNRIAELAARSQVCVAIDSIQGLNTLAEAASAAGSVIGILVDLDVGFHRTGVQSPTAALALAQHVSMCKSLRLDGLFFYPGHIWEPADEQREELSRIDAVLADTLEFWKKSGFHARIVSGGSTPTAYQSHWIKSQTEVRPGTYLFNDMNTARAGFCSLEDCAASLVCTVVSDAVPGKVVIDAGSKAFTSDQNVLAPDSGHGYVCGYAEARVDRLSEEHGELDVSSCDKKPKLAERVRVIPNHICPCINLQDEAWVRHSDGRLEALRIDARGKLT